MTKQKRDVHDIVVNMYQFDQLMRDTIENAIWLREYFRLELIYYMLVSGKGLEFDRIKDYYVGADPRRIDWKIFAKTGDLKIRSFKEERQYDIVIIVDVSDSMLLGTTERTKNEFAAMVAATLMFAAYEAGDNIGLVMISSEKEIVVEPTSEFVKIVTELTKKSNYGGQKNWKRLITPLNGSFDPDSILFIISDFIDTNPEIFLPEIASQFAKAYGIMVRDPVDKELPAGVGRMYLQDTTGHKIYLTDIDKVREEYKLLTARQIARIKETFQEYNQLFMEITPGQNFGRAFIEAVGGMGGLEL